MLHMYCAYKNACFLLHLYIIWCDRYSGTRKLWRSGWTWWLLCISETSGTAAGKTTLLWLFDGDNSCIWRWPGTWLFPWWKQQSYWCCARWKQECVLHIQSNAHRPYVHLTVGSCAHSTDVHFLSVKKVFSCKISQ